MGNVRALPFGLSLEVVIVFIYGLNSPKPTWLKNGDEYVYIFLLNGVVH